MKIVALLLMIFVGAGFGYYIFRGSNTAPKSPDVITEFYMEGRMQRTPQLESTPEIQAALTKMKAAGLCGIMYNVRTSQTAIFSKRGYDCVTEKWISMPELPGSTTPPYLPYKIQKFAILPRHNETIVVTEGALGQHTLSELQERIPLVINEAIEVFPKAKLQNEKSAQEYLEQTDADRKRQEEIKDSFSK
jgi:hypothetical protein